MVDEYQDTNRPQYLLIQRLAERHRNLCVVGDPDQSIYKWRGADLRNILDFEHDFPEAHVVRLERNYRSTQIILDAASSVIAQNKDRKAKGLYTERLGGDRVLYYHAGDDLDEAEFVARVARTTLADDANEMVGILYRTNAQSRTLEDALRRSGTPYKIVGGVRFYERREVKDALAFLKLTLNPHDDVGLRRIINVPARGIGKGVMEALETTTAARRGRRGRLTVVYGSPTRRHRPLALGQARFRAGAWDAGAARGELAVGFPRPRPDAGFRRRSGVGLRNAR